MQPKFLGEMDESELDFKMPEDGRIWGTAYPRPTSVAKATGTLDYGAGLGLKMPEGTLNSWRLCRQREPRKYQKHRYL